MNRIRMAASSISVAALVAASVLVPSSSGAGAATSKGTINVGIICACTGPLGANYAVGPPAYEAWAKSVNAAGGINGRKVNVISKDDQGNIGVSLAEAKSLISQHVVALVDDTNDDTAWGSLAQSAHVPVIGGGAVSALPLTNADFFSAETTEDVFALAQVESAKKVGATKIGDLYCAEAPACSQIVPILQNTAKALGLTVAYTKEISASQPSYAAECLASKDAGVDFLGIGESAGAVQTAATDCVQQGFTPWYSIGDGGVSDSNLTTPGLGTKSIGYETDIPYFLTTTPGMKLYLKAIKKYAPQILKSPNYGEEAVAMYVSGLLFGKAVLVGNAGKKGFVTTSEIYKGLYSIHHDTLGGMAPPLTFTAGKPSPVDCWYWIGIHNHKFTTPYGTAPFCKSPPPGTL
jgi:branched-chain amino acid transport system substrate-binding protein